jgi:hypothetical protein
LTGFHWVKFLIGFYLDPARPQARVDRVLGRPVGPGFKTMIAGALSFLCGWHVSAHHVKGGSLLQILSLKVTNNY